MQRILSDGLVLRSLSEGYASDRENLASFYFDVFSESDGEPDEYIGPWTESLLNGHPTTTADDVWVVVDTTQNDRIASALLLIPQRWRYESVTLGVGRVEIVATHLDYRRRGLVGALMQAAHERSAELGHTIQAITGIEHYYRRFGYTMAVYLGTFAAVPLAIIPEPKQPQQYTLRPVTEADIPQLIAWDAYAASQYLLTAVRSADEWRYDLSRPDYHIWWYDVLVITSAERGDVGYIVTRRRSEKVQPCLAWVVGPEASYIETFADALYGLKSRIQERYPDDPPAYINFSAGMHDSLLTMIRALYPAVTRDHHYAWYLRAASPACLLREIAPVLEQRLKGSGANAYSGELTIRFFDMTGLKLCFEHGRLDEAQDITFANVREDDAADAGFPWHSFIALVFGYRSIDELRHILPEVYANGRAHALLTCLFPPRRSRLMPLT